MVPIIVKEGVEGCRVKPATNARYRESKASKHRPRTLSLCWKHGFDRHFVAFQSSLDGDFLGSELGQFHFVAFQGIDLFLRGQGVFHAVFHTHLSTFDTPIDDPPTWLVWKQPNLPSLHTQWMTPTQSLEPSEIAIRGDQFTPVLDGQGRYVSIRDQRAALNGVTHFHKQVPVRAALWSRMLT